jgi:YHS domain-containing protein
VPGKFSANENSTFVKHDIALMKPHLSIPHTLARHIPLCSAIVLAFVCTLGLPAASAESKEKPAAAIQHYNLGADKVAIKGYDPVGYFTQNAAVKGKKELSSQYRGVTYFFSSDTNKKLFTAAPEKYLPTYGGWCATAMAKGEKVEIDPTNFKITNGRLFLFFKAFYANAIKDWNKDEPGQTAKADANWKKISGE